MKKMFLISSFLWSFLSSYSAANNDASVKLNLQDLIKQNIVIKISPVFPEAVLINNWCDQSCLFFNAKLFFKWDFFDYKLNRSFYILQPFANIPMGIMGINRDLQGDSTVPVNSLKVQFSPTHLFCGENCEIFQLQHLYRLDSVWMRDDPIALQVTLKSKSSLDLSKLCVPADTTHIVQIHFRNTSIDPTWSFLKNIFLKNKAVLKPVRCDDPH